MPSGFENQSLFKIPLHHFLATIGRRQCPFCDVTFLWPQQVQFMLYKRPKLPAEGRQYLNLLTFETLVGYFLAV